MPKSTNPLVILDLDNTLISSYTRKELLDEISSDAKRSMAKLDYDWIDDWFKVFERPRLQEFLTYLFANFDVGVWTAASKSYALAVIDKFIVPDADDDTDDDDDETDSRSRRSRSSRRRRTPMNVRSRKLKFILYSRHCRISMKKTGCIKNVAFLERIYSRCCAGGNICRSVPNFTQNDDADIEICETLRSTCETNRRQPLCSRYSNTRYGVAGTYRRRMIILDDNESVQKCNGTKRCIAVKEFEASTPKSHLDDELMTVVKPKLDKILRRNKSFGLR